jgi:thiamine pyrophosphate-dependent acetolactate synthase large subunit-like protein
MPYASPAHRSVAELVARFLVARGVDRIFGL